MVGSCDEYDLHCAGDAEDQAEAGASTGDVELLSRLVTGSSHVRYNELRQAIQVHGCGGQVVAHFPVSRKVASELAALVRRRS